MLDEFAELLYDSFFGDIKLFILLPVLPVLLLILLLLLLFLKCSDVKGPAV